MLAGKLNWPYIEITPADFVGRGMDQIYARTAEIFSDLMDLAGVVVLFDEMDALAAKRVTQPGAEQLDVVRQLLTTSMLPKLADLHDRKQIIYFMNTNHRNGIDSAIMRAGRFDMLLHVMPPTWSAKLRHLDRFYTADPVEVESAKERLRKWTARAAKERAALDRFTFAETKSFLEYIRRTRGHEKLSQALRGWDRHSFLQLVIEWGRSFIVLKENSPDLEEYKQDQGASSLQ
jgi:SpoVK/Ycf46/Vps4 family AAA+-type ATPase